MDARLSAKPIFKHREWAELIKPCLGNDGQDRQTVSTPKPPPVDPGPANNRIADHNDTQPADNHDHYGKVDDQNEVGEQENGITRSCQSLHRLRISPASAPNGQSNPQMPSAIRCRRSESVATLFASGPTRLSRVRWGCIKPLGETVPGSARSSAKPFPLRHHANGLSSNPAVPRQSC